MARYLESRTVVSAIYIFGLIILTCVAVWDVTNIIDDYTGDNRVTIVKTINITDRFPFLLGNIKVCFNYETFPIHPQKIKWEDLFPILRDAWTGQQKDSDKSENASTWERSLQAAIPHLYTYYVIADMDMGGPDIDANYSSTRPLVNEEFVNSTGFTKTELYSIIDSYISSPEKLLKMNQSLDILQFYLGGNTATESRTKPAGSSIVAEEGCSRIHVSNFLTPDKYRGTYAYFLTTDGMNPHLPPVTLSFPETTTIGLRPECEVTVVVSNIAVTDTRNFPPCTMDYETEEECLENMTVNVIVDVCKCAPLTRIARGSIDLSAPTPFCTTAMYEECWRKAMEDVSRRQAEMRKAKSCMPCIIPKNSYSTTIRDQGVRIYKQPTKLLQTLANFTEAEKTVVDFWPYAQVLISIICPDRSYILLQDKPQYNLSQLISQIGGDLGLYIGFSMISILEAILFVYHMQQKRRQSTNDDSDQPPTRNIADGCRDTIRFLFRNFNAALHNDNKSTTANRMATMSVESVLARLDSIQNDIQQALAYQSEINSELKRELRRLNDEIGAFRKSKRTKGVSRIPVLRKDIIR